MEDYIAKVKEHVVGQGEVTELESDDFLPPPPSQEFLDQLSGQMGQLSTGGEGYPTSPGGTYIAKPYNPQHMFSSGPKPYGSTSSSLSSSRNATPSPTSISEDHQHLSHGEIPKLSRPSSFGTAGVLSLIHI